MDRPLPIDLSTWARRQHFEHYRRAVPCTYSMTVELDVTRFVEALERSDRKTYVAQIWAIATVVNRHDEFRTCEDADGRPSLWPVVHPAFTVLDPDRETFSCVWVPYREDFAAFHAAASAVLAEHRGATDMFPLGPPPADTFDVSSVPWTSFTGFHLDIAGGHDHLAPVFTLGRYVERGGRVRLPLAVQVHHAVADGFHTARLVEELQALLADPAWVG